jgi:hypothetical protein
VTQKPPKKLVFQWTGRLRKLLFGTPFGEVFPAKANPPPKSVDGRTVALGILREYLAALVFYRPGTVDRRTDTQGDAIPFQIPDERIHIEMPDDEVQLNTFPAIALLSNGDAEYDMIGLDAYIEEKTRDRYGLGTVVQWQQEFVEEIAVEIWASSKPERRAMLAGLENALVPTEQMYGVRFRMPDYFDQLVCFTPLSRTLMENEDNVRNRKTARIIVQMRFNQVALVNYEPLTTWLKTEVNVDEDTNTSVTLGDIALENELQASPAPDPRFPREPCDLADDVADPDTP